MSGSYEETHSTIAVSDETKDRLDELKRIALGNRHASYDTTVGFLTNYYNDKNKEN